MARLSHEQIAAEVAAKGCVLIKDEGYENLNSRIIVQCKEKGHLVETCLGDMRKASWTCPCCDQSLSFINPIEIPLKGNSYRVLGFDQATEKFGVSVFDNGELVYYKLLVFTGDLNMRLLKIQQMLEKEILPNWNPDFVVMEDIQYQTNGLMTFKVLAMLLGIVETACGKMGVPFETVSPNVWRKYAGTCGKTRKEEKLLSVAVVKEKYNITVSDDVAEAILIGRYGTLKHKKEIGFAFGKK